MGFGTLFKQLLLMFICECIECCWWIMGPPNVDELWLLALTAKGILTPAFCKDQIIQVKSLDPVTKYEPHVSNATQVITSEIII